MERIEPIRERRGIPPVDALRVLTPVERELERERRERKRGRQVRRKPPQDGSAGGRLDVRG